MAEGLVTDPQQGDFQYGHSGPLRKGHRRPVSLEVVPRVAQGAQAMGAEGVRAGLGGRGLGLFPDGRLGVKAWMVSDLHESSGELPEIWLVTLASITSSGAPGGGGSEGSGHC